MSTFQLDQCSSAHRIVEACKEEGNGEALLLPADLRDTKDADLVPAMMAKDTVFVTKDHRLPRECAALIPDVNPGIVVVTNYPTRHQTLTVNLMLRILARVKSKVPQWHQAPLNNSILEITNEGVAIGHVEGGRFKNDGYFEFDGDNWPADFLATLQANSSRTPPGLAPGS